MSFDIDIPSDMGDKNLVNFFKGWVWHDDPIEPVVIRVPRGTHLAPWTATLFAAYGVWLKEVRGKKVTIDYDQSSYVGRFMERIGFLEALGEKNLNSDLDRKNIFPITRFSQSKDIAKIATSIVSMLDIGDEEIEGAVKYSIVELLRNVVQHSRSRIGGFVSAVYLPKSGLVDVIVTDIGCGLRASLKEAYKEINSDQKAVRFAMQPHVSGTFHSGAYGNMRDNAGLGLFFIKEIASRASGGFFLGSGDMLADVWGTPEGELKKRYIQSKSHGWRGTFALLQLRKETIGEFDELLSMCRKIAAEVRKDRTELSIDFLDEPLELDGLLTIKVRVFEEDVEEAAKVREEIILPNLENGEIIVLDFSKVRAATQSFIHALMYKLFRDGHNLETCLSVSCADGATEEAIKAVAAYANVDSSS